jgi:phosphoribosyl 1,2-cyclic phosphodiesterase
VSHDHPDHYGDAEIFLEGMTRGTTQRRGTLMAAKSVLSGNEVAEPSISRYHQSLVSELIEAHPSDYYQVEGMGVRVAKAVHTDPDGVGYVLEFPRIGKIGYTSDTEFFEGIADPYRGVRLLVLCVMRPRGAPLRGHLSTEDAEAIVASAKPEMAVLTHFGMRMLNENPSAQAKYVQDSTGIRTIAGFDGMVVSLEKEMKITSLEYKKQGVRRRSGRRRRSALKEGPSGANSRL